MTAHPSIERFQARQVGLPASSPPILEAGALRRVCLDCGADDVGFVSLDREEVASASSKCYSLSRKEN